MDGVTDLKAHVKLVMQVEKGTNVFMNPCTRDDGILGNTNARE